MNYSKNTVQVSAVAILKKPLFRMVMIFAFLLTGGEVVMALEQPKYDLIESVDEIEIRQYESYIVARTFVEGGFNDVGNEAFKRLGGYIFGDNREDQKISMTAPVTQGKSTEDGDYWVTFMMPSSFSLQSLPQPTDDRVQMVERPPQVFAVLKYRGGWSEKKYQQNENKLRQLLAKQTRWSVSGDPVWARYNPPFVPAFLRRNEILIPVSGPGK